MNEWNGLCVWFIYFFSFALWTLHFFHDNIIYCCGFSFTDSWKPHHVSRWFVIVYCFSMTRASVQTRLGGLLEFFLLCESNSYKFQNSNSTHGTWINPIMSSTLLLIHFAVVVFFLVSFGLKRNFVHFVWEKVFLSISVLFDWFHFFHLLLFRFLILDCHSNRSSSFFFGSQNRGRKKYKKKFSIFFSSLVCLRCFAFSHCVIPPSLSHCSLYSLWPEKISCTFTKHTHCTQTTATFNSNYGIDGELRSQ